MRSQSIYFITENERILGTLDGRPPSGYDIRLREKKGQIAETFARYEAGRALKVRTGRANMSMSFVVLLRDR